MTSKIVVNNIESDSGISSVTLVSNIAGEDSTQNISGINSVTATTFHGDGSQLSGISVDSTKIETGNTKVETIDTGSDGHIKFTTEGGERLRIHPSGRIAIGNNPTIHSDYILHIEDTGETNIKIEGSTSTLGARISLQNNDTTANSYSQYSFNDAGGQSTSAIQGINTDQTNNYGELAFLTRNAQGTPPQERMRITKDGYRTIPNQPYFKANKSAVISGTGVVVWNTVVYNQGSHYDSSNGRFTAPINGLYWFSAKINAYDRCDFWLQKNGTRFERGQYNTDNDQVGWWSNQLTSIVEMTAGEYVDVYVSALDQNTDPGEWLTFMGYLLY